MRSSSAPAPTRSASRPSTARHRRSRVRAAAARRCSGRGGRGSVRPRSRCRVRRHTFVVITIAIFFIFQLAAADLNNITNGTSGLNAPFLLWAPVTFDQRFYYIALALALATIALSWLIKGSRFGLQLRAIRDDEDRAASLGVRAMPVKLTAFVISGGAHRPGRRAVVLLHRPGAAADRLRPALRPHDRADGVPRRARHDQRPGARRADHRARAAVPDDHVQQQLSEPDPAGRAVPRGGASSCRAASCRPWRTRDATGWIGASRCARAGTSTSRMLASEREPV